MIFEIYSKILTDYGFKNIKDRIDKTGFKLAYVDKDEKLAFTDKFKITRECPRDIYTYSNNLFVSTATSIESKYYTNNINTSTRFDDISKNEFSIKNILSCYDTAKDINLSCGDIAIDIINKGNIEISYISFLEILILYMSYSSPKTKLEGNNIKLYIKDGGESVNVIKTLEGIIGRNNFTVFRGKDGQKSTIYIDSQKIFGIVTRLDDYLHRILIDSKLSRLFCLALKDLSEKMNFYDSNFPDFNVYFGRNLNKYIDYIAAFLVVNGYKIYFRRMPDTKYKLMFTNRDNISGFVGELQRKVNYAHYNYYDVHTEEELPIFVMETRDWISNVSLRATYDDIDNIKRKEHDELLIREGVRELDASVPIDFSDIFGGL